MTVPAAGEVENGSGRHGPGDDNSTTPTAAATTSLLTASAAATTSLSGTGTAGSETKDDLQGASRTTGGVLRGRAKGNVYNMADAMEVDDPFIKQAHGKLMVLGWRTLLI
jgi:hypothetical protein